jgi:hypothetical protein
MAMTDKKLSIPQIVTLLKACKDSGVCYFEYNDLKFRLEGSVERQKPLSQPFPTADNNLAPIYRGRNVSRKESALGYRDRESLSKDDFDVRSMAVDEELNLLKIENPLEYERLILRNELGDEGKDAEEDFQIERNIS